MNRIGVLIFLGAAFATAANSQPPVAGLANNPQNTRADAGNETPVEPKLICKKEEVTGSFVRSRKVCRTKAEWQRLAEDTRQQVGDYIQHGRGGSRGN